jgi:hypothetical protein
MARKGSSYSLSDKYLPDGYVGSAEIAKALGLAQVTVQQALAKGKVPNAQVFTMLGGRRIYCLRTVDLEQLVRDSHPVPVEV